MEVRHDVGNDMNIRLDAHDLDKLRLGYDCERATDEEGNCVPRVTVVRDTTIAEPAAQVSCRGDVSVQLPDDPYRVVLPLEIEAEALAGVDSYMYFGPKGRVVLQGEVEI